MADNNAYTVQQMLRDTLEVSGQTSIGDMYAKVKEMERQSLGLLPAGGYRFSKEQVEQVSQYKTRMGAIGQNPTLSGWTLHRSRAMNMQEIAEKLLGDAAGMQNAFRPKPMCFSATAAYKKRTAKTAKERKLADLMVFVAKYRDGKPGIVAFPEWLSKTGRDRLLEIAKRRA